MNLIGHKSVNMSKIEFWFIRWSSLTLIQFFDKKGRLICIDSNVPNTAQNSGSLCLISERTEPHLSKTYLFFRPVPLMAALSPPPPLLLPLPPQQIPLTRVSPFQPTHFPPFLSLRRHHHHNRSSYITNAATSSSSGVVATTTTTSGYATSEEHDAVNIAEDVTQVLF